MISSILVFQLGQARVWFAMSRDGLLPTVFSRIHPQFRTPAFATWVAGFVVGIPAGLLDIGTVSNLSNIGTLFAFVLVSIAVMILRYREPNRPRAFRAPLGPVFPILSIIFCIVLMMGLEVLTWTAFFIWLILGLLIYFLYSRHRSEFAPLKVEESRCIPRNHRLPPSVSSICQESNIPRALLSLSLTAFCLALSSAAAHFWPRLLLPPVALSTRATTTAIKPRFWQR